MVAPRLLDPKSLFTASAGLALCGVALIVRSKTKDVPGPEDAVAGERTDLKDAVVAGESTEPREAVQAAAAGPGNKVEEVQEVSKIFSSMVLDSSESQPSKMKDFKKGMVVVLSHSRLVGLDFVISRTLAKVTKLWIGRGRNKLKIVDSAGVVHEVHPNELTRASPSDSDRFYQNRDGRVLEATGKLPPLGDVKGAASSLRELVYSLDPELKLAEIDRLGTPINDMATAIFVIACCTTVLDRVAARLTKGPRTFDRGIYSSIKGQSQRAAFVLRKTAQLLEALSAVMREDKALERTLSTAVVADALSARKARKTHSDKPKSCSRSLRNIFSRKKDRGTVLLGGCPSGGEGQDEPMDTDALDAPSRKRSWWEGAQDFAARCMPSFLAKRSRSALDHPLPVGRRVDVNLGDDLVGRGTIVEVDTSGGKVGYKIDYDCFENGGKVSPDMIISLAPDARDPHVLTEKPALEFQKHEDGAEVQHWCDDDKWYNGVVTKVYDDGKGNVFYDVLDDEDGKTYRKTPEHEVRPREDSETRSCPTLNFSDLFRSSARDLRVRGYQLISHGLLSYGFQIHGGFVGFLTREAHGDPDTRLFKSDIDTKIPGMDVNEAHDILVGLCDDYGFELRAHDHPRNRLWSHWVTVPGSPEIQVQIVDGTEDYYSDNTYRPPLLAEDNLLARMASMDDNGDVQTVEFDLTNDGMQASLGVRDGLDLDATYRRAAVAYARPVVSFERLKVDPSVRSRFCRRAVKKMAQGIEFQLEDVFKEDELEAVESWIEEAKKDRANRGLEGLSQKEMQELYYTDVAKLVPKPSSYLKSTYQMVFGQIVRADGLVGGAVANDRAERLAQGSGPPELRLVWYFCKQKKGVKIHDPRRFDTEKQAAAARAEYLKQQGIGTGKLYVSKYKFVPTALALAVREGRAYDPKKINLGEAEEVCVSDVLLFHDTREDHYDKVVAEDPRGFEKIKPTSIADRVGRRWILHSKTGEKVWCARTVVDVARHMGSPKTIDRHLAHEMTTFGSWTKITVFAFPRDSCYFNPQSLTRYVASGWVGSEVYPLESESFDLKDDDVIEQMQTWASNVEESYLARRL